MEQANPIRKYVDHVVTDIGFVERFRFDIVSKEIICIGYHIPIHRISSSMFLMFHAANFFETCEKSRSAFEILNFLNTELESYVIPSPLLYFINLCSTYIRAYRTVYESKLNLCF